MTYIIVYRKSTSVPGSPAPNVLWILTWNLDNMPWNQDQTMVSQWCYVMLWPLLNCKYFCEKLSKYFCQKLSKYFCQKLCKYFWSKIMQIFLVKNCANIFGKKLCKYFWSKILQIILVKNCAKPLENQQRTREPKSILHDKYVDTLTVGM